MTYTTGLLNTEAKVRLFWHHWSVPAPKARVVIVHGYGEHGQRYHVFASYLNDHGYEVLAYDQRGHGRSEGLKAYISKFEDWINDLRSVLNYFPSPGINILFGHSMGGLVAVKYCLDGGQKDFGALILSGAALKLDDDLSPILQKLAPILGFLVPKWPLTPLDLTTLTRSPENRENYLSDPLVYKGGTRARTGAEVIKTTKRIPQDFASLDIPLLALHGTADKITDPEGTKRLFNAAQSTIKEIKLYEGLYHELIHEPEGGDVINDITLWIENIVKEIKLVL